MRNHRRCVAADATSDPFSQRRRIALLPGDPARRRAFLIRTPFSRVLGILISETAISEWSPAALPAVHPNAGQKIWPDTIERVRLQPVRGLTKMAVVFTRQFRLPPTLEYPPYALERRTWNLPGLARFYRFRSRYCLLWRPWPARCPKGRKRVAARRTSMPPICWLASAADRWPASARSSSPCVRCSTSIGMRTSATTRIPS